MLLNIWFSIGKRAKLFSSLKQKLHVLLCHNDAPATMSNSEKNWKYISVVSGKPQIFQFVFLQKPFPLTLGKRLNASYVHSPNLLNYGSYTSQLAKNYTIVVIQLSGVRLQQLFICCMVSCKCHFFKVVWPSL